MTHYTDYRKMVDDVLAGPVVDSRIGPTNEVLGASIRVPSGVIVDRAGLNPSLGFAEGLLVVAGRHDADVVRAVAPSATIGLFRPGMSYGPRLDAQFEPVLEALRGSWHSRQAVLVVSHRGDLGEGERGDVPCTTAVQFLVRPGAGGLPTLNTFVTMRSWDLARGVPYDLMTWGVVSQVVGAVLDLPVGFVEVYAASLHRYHHTPDARLAPSRHGGRMFALNPIDAAELRGVRWGEVRWWADQELLRMKVRGKGSTPTSFDVLREVLHPVEEPADVGEFEVVGGSVQAVEDSSQPGPWNRYWTDPPLSLRPTPANVLKDDDTGVALFAEVAAHSPTDQEWATERTFRQFMSPPLAEEQVGRFKVALPDGLSEGRPVVSSQARLLVEVELGPVAHVEGGSPITVGGAAYSDGPTEVTSDPASTAGPL